MTIGGDKLDYTEDSTSPAATILDTNILLNSVISDAKRGSRFLSIDLKDYFLQTQLQSPEFMRIHVKYFPPDIRKQYTINKMLLEDVYVYL